MTDSKPARQPDTRSDVARTAMRCPHCGEPARIGAEYCPSCTRRILGFERCSECFEPISADARYCPYCTQRVRRFRGTAEAEEAPLDLAVIATRLGCACTGVSITGAFRPSIVQLREDALFIRRTGGLTASRLSIEIPVRDLADIRSRSGLIWGTVEIIPTMDLPIETVIIRGLRKESARRFANRLSAMLFRSRKA